MERHGRLTNHGSLSCGDTVVELRVSGSLDSITREPGDIFGEMKGDETITFNGRKKTTSAWCLVK